MSARSRAVAPGGFSLLELLLVLAIVGILAGAVVAGFTDIGQHRRVQTEAERLAMAIEQARTEAAQRNEIWGVALRGNGYAFKRHQRATGRWQDVELRPFGAWQAEQGVAFELGRAFRGRNRTADALASANPLASGGEGEDRRERRRRRGDADSDNEDDRADWPAIAILPGGEITPHRIVVSNADAPAWAVQSDGIERVRALPRDEADERDLREQRTRWQ